MPAIHSCGRCGGRVDPGLGQAHPLGQGVETWRVACPVCRVDRVERWSDLVRAAAAEGTDLRREIFPIGNERGSANVLRSAELVTYDAEECAWELTAKGNALLERWDALAVVP